MQLVGCSPVPKAYFCVEGHLMAGGRAWRLLGSVAVLHVSSAEGETGSMPCISSCRVSAGCVWLGYFLKTPQGGDDASSMAVYILTLLATQDDFGLSTGCWLWC